MGNKSVDNHNDKNGEEIHQGIQSVEEYCWQHQVGDIQCTCILVVVEIGGRRNENL